MGLNAQLALFAGGQVRFERRSAGRRFQGEIIRVVVGTDDALHFQFAWVAEDRAPRQAGTHQWVECPATSDLLLVPLTVFMPIKTASLDDVRFNRTFGDEHVRILRRGHPDSVERPTPRA